MSRRPWFYFFPTDWQADANLRVTSLAGQGLWLHMLCLMHGAEPRGHLVMGGEAIGVPRLAKIVGCDTDEAAGLLRELEGNGIFDRTDDGVIVSRKMVRDTAKSLKQSANANARWSRYSDDPVSGNPIGNASGNAKTHAESMPHMGVGLGLDLGESGSSDIKNLDPVNRGSAPSRAGSPDPIFAAAWAACTDVMRRRSSQSKSSEAWRAAIKRAEPSVILASLKAYRARDADVQRTGGPGFHVWLNDSRWEGWVPRPAAVAEPAEMTPDIMARCLRHYRATGEWRAAWGEQPRAAA